MSMASSNDATAPSNDSLSNFLERGSQQLEQARWRETTSEAWTCLASQLLQTSGLQRLPSVDNDSKQQPPVVSSALQQLKDAATEGLASVGPVEETKNNKGQLTQALHTTVLQHSLDQMAAVAQKIVQERSKEDGLKRSIQQLQRAPRDPNEWLHVLDERLAAMRQRHVSKRLRVETDGVVDLNLSTTCINPLLQEERMYTANEVLGKYLDLQALYQQALHEGLLEFAKKEDKALPYREFLSSISSSFLTKLRQSAPRSKVAIKWLQQVQDYLESFLSRTVVLYKEGQRDQLLKKEAKGDDGELEVKQDSVTKGIDLRKYDTPEALSNAVDANDLKSELSRIGLKCGGTPLQRAQRLWLLRDGKSVEDLPDKVKTKKAKNGTDSTAAASTNTNILRDPIPAIQALLDQLHPTLQATLRRLERQQGQSVIERERDLIEELYGTGQDDDKDKKDNGDSDDDDEPVFYNPKNVPLDWDGKPIPYWLFKLHGLQHYYVCEICGGERYRGRRNFEVHFNEQRHGAGMKRLGIPNTKHFHGITTIADAQELWKKLQERQQEQQDDQEQYEDSHGNVLSRATYEDLARQGLL